MEKPDASDRCIILLAAFNEWGKFDELFRVLPFSVYTVQ